MATDFSVIFSKIDPVRSSKLDSGTIKYGTAGFRANAATLDFVVYRMGILATLRSKSLTGKVIGLMITASHNPEEDNGVKLVDPTGEMLEASWEEVATRVATADNISAVLEDVVKSLSIDWKQKGVVFLGRDTRPSSVRLAEGAKKAIEDIGGLAIDCEVVTTPMLHFFVAEANANNVVRPPTNQDYFSKLATAYARLNNAPFFGNYTPVINFDGANGVGAIAMRELAVHLKPSLTVNIYNSGAGRLNYKCGSDFVKVNMRAPDGLPVEAEVRSVAVDGDADRLIYFYLDKTLQLHMFDGDRIATLLASYLIELLRASGLQLKMGLVQTAYANGAATQYILEVLKVPLACTETGVKYLHHKALEFDIGVYFEANGHGTVVYSDEAVRVVKAAAGSDTASPEAKISAQRLLDIIKLTNQAVGDALSDLLLVETVLRARGWALKDWEASYTNLPSRLLKVTIKDRDSVTTTNAARRCVTPVGLQDEIDRIVASYQNGRAFVRSSGTEDVVRVYAEATTQQQADELGILVSRAVYSMADGVGELPSLSA